MLSIAVKVILELVGWVFILTTIIHSIYYVIHKDYQAFVYYLVKESKEFFFIDYLTVITVFPGAVFRHYMRKLLKLIKKCATMLHNKPKETKVVVYYVPKHWKHSEW